MTPRELARENDAAIARLRDERKRDIALAWRVAAYAVAAWNNKLQPLSTLLAEVAEPSNGMSVDGMAQAMRAIGIPSRPVTDEARKAMRFRES